MAYTDEQVKYIKELRNSGMEWDDVADTFNGRYPGETKTGNSLRKTYSRYRDDDISDEVLVSNLRATYTARKSASKAKKETRALIEQHLTVESFIVAVKDAVKNIKPVKIKAHKKTKGKNMTVELLLSDLQLGKLSPSYNTPVAKARLQEFASAAIFKIKQHISSGYNVERIVLAMLGDIIESSEKHNNSARATDCSTPDQIKESIVALYSLVIEPLSQLGIKMDVVCITGNHDWDGHGLNMYDSGREQLSWPLYHAMKMISKAAGMKHVNFEIPIGTFFIYDIYGRKVLYEHGVGVSCAEASMKAHVAKRAAQIGEFITYFRMGDKHNISRFNNDSYVVNGAFFGTDQEGREYSSIVGFNNQAAQLMICYVEHDNGDLRMPLYDSFVIQLEHITE